MAEKPEAGVKIWHILIPAATTVMVALIGLFTAVYQVEKPIQATAAAAASTFAAARFLPVIAIQPPAAVAPSVP